MESQRTRHLVLHRSSRNFPEARIYLASHHGMFGQGSVPLELPMSLYGPAIDIVMVAAPPARHGFFG